MAEVLVICRFVARTGTEVQLRALLQGVLAPTNAEPGCKLYELYESDPKGRFYLYETWESQAALDQLWQRHTLSAWNKPAGNW